MGANQSSSVKQVTDITNKAITNVKNTSTITANTKNTNKNSFTLYIGPNASLECDSINLGQKINATQSVSVSQKIASTNDMKTLLKSAVDNAVAQNNASVNGFLSTAFNNQKSNTEIKNILKNEIENNITNENVTECNSILDNANDGKIEIYGSMKCQTLNNPQEIISQQLVNCFQDALQQAVMNNANIADAVNKSKQDNTSENKGISELASALLGPYAMIIIAIVIGLIVFIPLIIFALKSGKKGASGKDLADIAKSVSDAVISNPVQKLAKVWSRKI
jgi:hypothetical protein